MNHWRNDADVASSLSSLATEAVQLRAQMTSAGERRQSTEPADYNKMTSLLRTTPTVILLISAAAAPLAGVGSVRGVDCTRAQLDVTPRSSDTITT